MIDVLGECVALKNYHTAMSMISAILSTPVDRLAKTWKGIPSKCKKSFQVSKELLSMDNNFLSLRTATYSASLPLLPYVGLTMGDITGIQQANIVSNDSIVFEQLDVMARVIAHVRHCQTNPYHYRAVGDFASLIGKNVILDQKELYKRSKEIEQGEKKDDDPSSSPKGKSFAIPFTIHSPKETKKERKEGEGEGEGGGPPKVLTPLFSSNPYSNRFTPSQLTVMLNFLDAHEGKPIIESKDFMELREKVGKTGQGGLLLSKGVIYSWLVLQFDSTAL